MNKMKVDVRIIIANKSVYSYYIFRQIYDGIITHGNCITPILLLRELAVDPSKLSNISCGFRRCDFPTDPNWLHNNTTPTFLPFFFCQLHILIVCLLRYCSRLGVIASIFESKNFFNSPFVWQTEL